MIIMPSSGTKKMSRNSAMTMSSFIEFRKYLESVVNKFPKHEKFSMCKQIYEDAFKIYEGVIMMVSTQILDKNISESERSTFLAEYRKTIKTINHLRYILYLAYHLNYYYRCKNDGSRNRCVTDTIDATKNREGYINVSGYFSIFLSEFYILCSKVLHRNKYIDVNRYKDLLKRASAELDMYIQDRSCEEKLIKLKDVINGIESEIKI